jgi:hypothetical protein
LSLFSLLKVVSIVLNFWDTSSIYTHGFASYVSAKGVFWSWVWVHPWKLQGGDASKREL